MSRQTRFARAFEPWISRWSQMGLSGTQERVLLLIIENMEPDGKGGFTSWRPRAEMAEILGLSELTIKDAVNALVRKGALKRLGKAYRGTAQNFQIMPGTKGEVVGHPIKSERGGSDTSKGVATALPKGRSTATPIRIKNSDPASSSRPVAEKRREVGYAHWGEPTV